MKKLIKISIEQATLKDLEEVADLYTHFWGESTDIEKMGHIFEKISNDSRYCLLVARFENRVLGTIYGIVCDELYGDCRPFMIMEDLIVSPVERRKGIAKALLGELELLAKKRNCSQILFISEHNRIDAVSFYGSQGYDTEKNIGFKKKL